MIDRSPWPPSDLSTTTAPVTRPFSKTGSTASVVLADPGAGGDRVVGDHLVELAAAHDVAVVGEAGMLGPGHLEGDAVGDGPQPVVAVVVLEAIGQAHVVERGHRPRGEAVAAGLVAGEQLLLDDEDVVAGSGQPVGGGGTGRAAADHQDVGAVSGADRVGRQPAAAAASVAPPRPHRPGCRRGRRRCRSASISMQEVALVVDVAGLDRVLAAELGPLVDDDGEQFLGGQAGEGGHHVAAAAHRLVGGAVDVADLGLPAGRPEARPSGRGR